MHEEKTNIELLKELQGIVDEYNSTKEQIENLLNILDSQEKKYYEIESIIKKKNKNKK